ncbi:hypothetical protein LA080_005535 [Diaporthe eres]|nr:hypothetical protein LA080_005535 [Diaporthe eres]
MAISLGIKYVWIDSICIVQQDTADWENEASMMAGYYQNAWLTVAATRTVVEGGGFLHQTTMDPSSIPRVSRLPYRNREGRQEGYFYLQGLPGSTLRQEYEDNIINSDLLNRGWVFQEWILSPRILCFSTLMPFLVCFQAQQDITSVTDPFSYGHRGFLEHGYKHRLGLDLTASRAALFNTWRNLITVYSSLEITRFENDRLVALAGVAKEIGLALSAKAVDRPGTESDGWSVNLSQSNDWKTLDPFDQRNDYGNSNRFVGLCFPHAKFIDVQLGPRFDSQKGLFNRSEVHKPRIGRAERPLASGHATSIWVGRVEY